jgi:hypothetical protein
MRRIYVCVGIFVVIIAFSVVCHIYVKDTIQKTTDLLTKATESHSIGDYESARAYVDSAWVKWQEMSNIGNLVLSDLTVAVDVTISLSRVVSLAEGEDKERFREETAAAILLLEHLKADNHNVWGGLNRPD